MSNASPSSNLPAIAAVLLGLACYSGMDAIMKGLVLALGAYNAIFWRMAVGFVMAAALFFAQRRRWPGRAALKVHLIRGGVTFVMGYLFFWGLGRVPLAEGIALSFIAPLIALYLAVLLLGEVIGKSAILASLLGIAGVVVILVGKMQGSFPPDAQWGVAAILGSALLYAYNLILQRQLAQIASSAEVVFFQTGIVTLLYLALAPWFAALPPAENWPFIVAAAAVAMVSLMLIIWGYARAEAQHLVSLEYTAFIWAAILGWLFFDEAVTWATFIGTALIVSGCLIVAWRRPEKAEIVEAAVA
ncbi:DMT family transporter [Parasphingopyxis marina]|uniref:DMT family transporter n=1 Tax=Parasphingopyxis marina TaxID=2761622 RepID=A0A842HU76_9SPHN|nr:DMT family transporter [Parasphingopyxis marina]MBC2776083.1 DMT family transporter [Parasphingopyxis marina]